MSHSKVIYKLEIFDYVNDDPAWEHIVGYYSTKKKAKKGLRDYLTDTCHLTIEESGLDAPATMKKHAAEGKKGRALLADDGETAYYHEYGVGIYEECLDEEDDVEDEALAEMEVEAFNAEVAADEDEPTNQVAELADKAPYMTAPIWRQLDGLNEKTKRVLAVAGITNMGQLAHRSDQQLLSIKHFDQECLDDLLTALRKMVEEEQA